jgi:hypothetical protein
MMTERFSKEGFVNHDPSGASERLAYWERAYRALASNDPALAFEGMDDRTCWRIPSRGVELIGRDAIEQADSLHRPTVIAGYELAAPLIEHGVFIVAVGATLLQSGEALRGVEVLRCEGITAREVWIHIEE